MADRPGVSDRLGISKDRTNQIRPILTQDGGFIDGRDNYQYDDRRNLNMNIDVKEPNRKGERELDMDDDGIYKRIVRA